MLLGSSNQQTKALVESELRDLHKKYRVLDLENRSFNDQSEGVLRKQKNLIHGLSGDNNELVGALAVYRATPRDVDSRLEAARKAVAVMEAGSYEEKLQEEIARGAAIQKERERVHDRLLKTKSVSGSESSCSSTTILEQRLDRTIVRLNEVVSANGQLRASVDTLRREKQTYEKIEKRLVRELKQIEREIFTVGEETKGNYAAKDKSCADLGHFSTIAERERGEFEKELFEINRLLEGDLKVHEFMAGKRVKKAEITAVVTEERLDGPISISDDDSKMTPTSQLFESAFSNLKHALGAPDITTLIHQFSAGELRNFSLFNRLNQTQAELDRLGAMTELARAEIRHLRLGIHGDQVPGQLAELTSASLKLTEKFTSDSKLFDRVKKVIESIHFRLIPEGNVFGCIADDNVHLFLSQIDGEIDKLLGNASLYRSTHRPPPLHRHPQYLPSSHAREPGDEDLRVVSRQEIHTQLKRGSSAATTRPPSTSKG